MARERVDAFAETRARANSTEPPFVGAFRPAPESASRVFETRRRARRFSARLCVFRWTASAGRSCLTSQLPASYHDRAVRCAENPSQRNDV